MQINQRYMIRMLQVLAVGLLAAFLLAAIPVSTDKSVLLPPLGSNVLTATSPMIGTFTGEYANGVPVYRLPPISITADRKTELAKMEREDLIAADWQKPELAKPSAQNHTK
ncbi:MAG: hypothetical protein ABI537_15970 [Casimicrobiaceae bacterium]